MFKFILTALFCAIATTAISQTVTIPLKITVTPTQVTVSVASQSTTIPLPGSPPPTACAKSAASYTTSGIFDSKNYGNYLVNNNNWGGTQGQVLWANSQDCWGTTNTTSTDIQNITSYPSVTRGWSQNATPMQQLSTPGTNDWTVKSGMGIQVASLVKAKVHWAFKAPLNTATVQVANQIRWLGLMDVYLHPVQTPNPSQFPPHIDIMIDQALADEILNSTTYYASGLNQAHASLVTISGVTYAVDIDDPGESSYHSAGGHTIHLFRQPTAFLPPSNNPNWGVQDGVTDLAAIIALFSQASPKNDAGAALLDASGQPVSALIPATDYLTSINAGWEIDNGTPFINTAFCVAMQAEKDCP